MSEPSTGTHATSGAHTSGHGSAELKRILGQKVGPLPMWGWVAIAGVILLYIKSKQGGGISSLWGGGKGSSAVPNQQTDPAGNIGSIDPATGYVYGTPEDLAALAANNSGGTGTGNGTPAPTSQTYADNNAWARAALNYLVGLGTDPTQANEALQQYLASQALTTQQQADVNLAIQALGPPPQLPGPIGTPPGSTVPPPGSTVKVPSTAGMTAGSAHNAIVAAGLVPTDASGGTKGEASWKVTGTNPVSGTDVSKGSKVAIMATQPTGSTGGGTPKTYTVVKGDTLSGIASKVHYPGGWQALYAANRGVIGANPNLIKPGEVLKV